MNAPHSKRGDIVPNRPPARVVPDRRLGRNRRSQAIDSAKELCGENVKNGPNQKSGKLRFEQVNNVTWKLTDGSQAETPRCHGKWPGFHTPRAIGWIFGGGDGWRARVRKGRGWRAFGLIVDLDHAKRVVLEAMQKRPRPAEARDV